MTAHYQLYETFRVRYAEVDAQAVVFNSRYLEYADIVLTEFFREKEIALVGPEAFDAHVVEATVRYIRPLRFDDIFEGWAKVAAIGRSSISFEIEFRLADQSEACAHVLIHWVHVDLETGKSAAVPDDFRVRLLAS